MKVAIFETEHFEGSYPVIKLFDDTKNNITIFTYEPAYKQFQHLFHSQLDKYEWIIKPGRRSKYIFIFEIFREIKKRKIKIAYLNTISNNFFVYALMIFLLRDVRIIVTIHSINSYFEYKKSFSLRRIVRYIGRKILLSVVKEFNVVSMTMVNYLENKLPPGKKVHCVPGAVFEESVCRQTQPNTRDHINIVIPGTIDARRRNYEQAFALIHLLEQLKIPSTIAFLGGFYEDYGKRILKKCKAMHMQHTQLKYYELTTVDQPEFDKVMNEANFVFIPSVINTIIEDGIAEIYGTSISSGNLFDVIKHAKPFIIPKQLKVDPFLEKSCYRYEVTEDIAIFITTVHNNVELYATLQQAALEGSRNYTIEKVRERNASLFDIK
jgi:hypothetical protein